MIILRSSVMCYALREKAIIIMFSDILLIFVKKKQNMYEVVQSTRNKLCLYLLFIYSTAIMKQMYAFQKKLYIYIYCYILLHLSIYCFQ